MNLLFIWLFTSHQPVFVQIPVDTDVHEQKSNKGNETMNNDVKINVVDLERMLLTEIHRDRDLLPGDS